LVLRETEHAPSLSTSLQYSRDEGKASGFFLSDETLGVQRLPGRHVSCFVEWSMTEG